MADKQRIVRDGDNEWIETFYVDAAGTEHVTGFELVEQPWTEEDQTQMRKTRKVWKTRQTKYRRKNGIRDTIPEHMGFSVAHEDGDEVTSLPEAPVPELPQS